MPGVPLVRGLVSAGGRGPVFVVCVFRRGRERDEGGRPAQERWAGPGRADGR